MSAVSVASRRRTELSRYWPLVLACFATAVFAWGFGFYGQSVYLAELRRAHGWSTAVIASSTTAFYLVGALLLTRIHAILDRLGPRGVLIGGVMLLGGGAVLLSRSQSQWHLYVGASVMAAGWAATSVTAISTTLALFFDSQRGLAISLALNGASAAGFTVAPVLVTLSSRVGLAGAVTDTVLVLLAALIPLILVCVGRPVQQTSTPHAAAVAASGQPVLATTGQALRDPRFWSIAAPFALVLAAQVGVIVHLVALLLPHLGARGTAVAVSIVAGAAMAGRLGLGFVIDRLNQRRASAISFASQAVALGLMVALPDWPTALYGACLLFGLSVGNVITLPSLIVQREFASRSFGLVIGLSTAVGQLTYAFAPALIGALHDAFDGYGPALMLCMALELIAALMIRSVPRSPSRPGSIPRRAR
jgi:predicted MFS family arabinose efflux permease